MTKRILLAAFTLALGIAPIAANAGEVNNRLHNENARINQGVRNGQINWRENARLRSQQARIDAARERDLRNHGGRLTPAEYRHLNARENNLSRKIYVDRHNNH